MMRDRNVWVGEAFGAGAWLAEGSSACLGVPLRVCAFVQSPQEYLLECSYWEEVHRGVHRR